MGDVKTVPNGKCYGSFPVDTKIIPCHSKHVYMDEELVEVQGIDSQKGISQSRRKQELAKEYQVFRQACVST